MINRLGIPRYFTHALFKNGIFFDIKFNNTDFFFMTPEIEYSYYSAPVCTCTIHHDDVEEDDKSDEDPFQDLD